MTNYTAAALLDCIETIGASTVSFNHLCSVAKSWVLLLTFVPVSITVLKAAGVELGVNYPKPIIDIDLAREHLTEAIFKMWEMKQPQGLQIEVFLKEMAPCPTNSSYDQRVSTNQNYKNIPAHRKGSKFIEEERTQPYILHNNVMQWVPQERMKNCVLRTAESSASKKQATSRSSFCSPVSFLIRMQALAGV
ncbi:hypothetical protein DKX38_013218 [Salix brachista]|uniref:Uncharacterized protein n=1 Tax=Salix brachista TaxID=2182728 RepID=A0A5N5LSN9_9ROSI|nr:hypothetical protein DKX38_013218 [Salix brachista]